MTASNGNRLPKFAWALALTIAVSAFSAPALAQDAPAATSENAVEGLDPERVYATIDGVPITEADLAAASEDYAETLARMPPEVRLSQLLNVVIDMRLLADAAEEAGIGEKDSVKRRVAFERARTLRNEYLRDKAVKTITDEKVQERFDKEIADFVPGDEFHLRHILVKTEDEGKEVIADIEGGADFAEVAKEKSLDPGSAPNGGDLGFVPKGKTVPEFEEAAFALDVGGISTEPVESQFGWHVIKVEEKRQESPPELATEEPRIRNELIREFVTAEVETLRAAAVIEIVTPEDPAAEDGGPPAQGGAVPVPDGTETPAQ
jgi:peptidyl-prolyl cis-trans isomerase C